MVKISIPYDIVISRYLLDLELSFNVFECGPTACIRTLRVHTCIRHVLMASHMSRRGSRGRSMKMCACPPAGNRQRATGLIRPDSVATWTSTYP